MCKLYMNVFELILNRTVGFGIAKLAVYYNVFAGQYGIMFFHGCKLILGNSSRRRQRRLYL